MLIEYDHRLIELLIIFAYCLTVTVSTELIFALMCCLRSRDDLKLVALANVLTNPWVVFANALLADTNLQELGLIALEAAAIACEAYIYHKYCPTLKHPIGFSIGANAFSLASGYLIAYLYYLSFC
ncbi:hypothetical protein IJT17_10875 [bacterium]|nr:hypothetical protein [bacterium]